MPSPESDQPAAQPQAPAGPAPSPSSVQAFRYVAIAEAISWLLLIVATIVKYAASAPIGVKILGPIHGMLFIAYVLLALSLMRPLGWSRSTLLIVLGDAILPGGGFLVARRDDLQPRADSPKAPATSAL
ncbi:integral membrane protein [Frankineae bacterium MT45]|nr:integral membrane protein [Frankineae bacterium MT45]